MGETALNLTDQNHPLLQHSFVSTFSENSSIILVLEVIESD